MSGSLVVLPGGSGLSGVRLVALGEGEGHGCTVETQEKERITYLPLPMS